MSGAPQDEDDDEAGDATKVSKPSIKGVIAGPSPQLASAGCLVVVYVPMDNPAAAADLGRRIPVENSVTIGRNPQNTLQLDQEDVSRRHAEVYFENGEYFVRDMGSRNGTAVNDQDIRGESRGLRDGDRLSIGSTILKFIQDDTENQFHETIYRLKVEDALTRIHNKRFLLEYLEREMSRSQRHKSPMSLLLYDIDHFKKINDTHGHLAGDYVLRDSAAVIKAMVRKEECFARYGGEEFALVQPEVSIAPATVVAEKIRKAIEGATFSFENQAIPCTVSVGVAELDPSMHDASEFIKRADERLYRAKREGRNRVISE